MPTVADIAGVLEQWAPPASAQSYDNVGLQVGDPGTEVERAIVALDMTPGVLEEAEEADAQLILTHHPLLFHGQERIAPDEFIPSLVYRLARSGIACYAAHTNLDAAPGGVSFALGEQLGLRELEFLSDLDENLCKLVTFVPPEDADAVRAALAEAGAGEIGEYDGCAFETEGTGYFRASDEADPHVGEADGSVESVTEERLEVQVVTWKIGAAVRALEDAHPYEEVAYDVYPLDQPYSRAGMGVIGRLPEPESLAEFLERITDRTPAETARYVGEDETLVERIACCGGAGSDLIGAALSAGADAFVTADCSYHEFFTVLDPGGTPRMALVDPGHYETEAVTEELLINRLSARFPEIDWRRTEKPTTPVKSHPPRPS